MRLSSIALCILVLLAAAYPAFADDTDVTLRGLRAFWVNIGVGDPARGLGADSATVYADAESRLRQDGIGILSREEYEHESPNDGAILQIDMMSGAPICASETAIVIKMHVLQWVRMERDPSVPELAETWGSSMLYFCDPKTPVRLRSVVQDMINRFVDSYLAANPKGSKGR